MEGQRERQKEGGRRGRRGTLVLCQCVRLSHDPQIPSYSICYSYVFHCLSDFLPPMIWLSFSRSLSLNKKKTTHLTFILKENCLFEAENKRGPFQSLFGDFYPPSSVLFRKHRLTQSHLGFLSLEYDQACGRHQVKAICFVWPMSMELCTFVFLLNDTCLSFHS